ncbi:alpha/beta hydrolase [Anaerococcus lactolyticus]|uniref:alpha/beta hydrolase n=1 Tax=Anaerococcus lactolyticus TaxID=33032 RepID=UPI0023F473AB|nr:alpha/beta hydrolase [Anaerococcus lactolyticus]
MNENKKDLYPDLGLEDIIEILRKKDESRLACANYSTGEVRVVSNLAYKDDGDFYHNFDIYYGKSSGSALPTVVNVHGGGLVYGRKELNKGMGISFAQMGFNVVNINYRLLPDVTFTDQVKDVADAFSYIYENSSKLKLNRSEIFILSDSAGSLLSLAALSLMKDDKICHIFGIDALDFDISAMAFISPMIGLVKSGSLSLINEPARRNLSKDQIPFVDNILEALENTDLPQSIIVTSEEDFIKDQALNLKNFLDSKNIKNKFLDFKKNLSYPLGHGFAISHPHLAESWLVIDEINNFFKNI